MFNDASFLGYWWVDITVVQLCSVQDWGDEFECVTGIYVSVYFMTSEVLM